MKNILLALFFVFPTALVAKTVTIAFTQSLPPYLSKDNKSGIERDIIVAALEASGVKIGKIYNVNYKRAAILMRKKEVDGIVANQGNQSYSSNGFPVYESASTISYVDCAVTKRSRKMALKSLTDYSGRIIWAFKSAKEVFGSEFKKMAETNKGYTEAADQENQSEMLIMERIDIAISDRNIFTHKVLHGPKGFGIDKFDFHHFTESTPRNLKFRSDSVRQLFNRGVKAIRKNGKYHKILKKYQKFYKPTCA